MAILITVTSFVSGATSAKSQAVAELFSYKAPSGAPGDGIAKWELYRFIHEDAERVANLRAINRSTTTDGLAVRDATYSQAAPRWWSLPRVENSSSPRVRMGPEHRNKIRAGPR
jgi:hypothetical protein